MSERHDYICVHLHPLLISNEASALMAVAAQLELTREIEAAKVGSFCDGLRFVLHLLRRARPGAQGEARREAQAQPVCFVLHEFEQFALRSKQTLLYSLFDLVQTDEAHMAVVGISTRVDALDLLEKRVRSRFSGRQIVLPSLYNLAECCEIVSAALAFPAELPATARPLESAEGSASDAEEEEQVSSPGAEGRYAEDWARAHELLLDGVRGSHVLMKHIEYGLTARQLLSAIRLSLLELRASGAYPTLCALEKALDKLAAPPVEVTLRELSVVELLLLICLSKLIDKDMAPPHTLALVLGEYAGFVAAGADAAGPFDLPHALLAKAFENLCALGLVLEVPLSSAGSARHLGPALRMRLSSSVLRAFVRAHASRLPLVVKKFGTTWLS